MTAEPTVQTAAVRRPHPRRNALIIIAIAFLAGLVTMGWAMNRFSRPGSWFDRSTTSQTDNGRTDANGQIPVQPAPVFPAAPPTTLDSRVAELEARLANIDVKAEAASGNATRAEGLLLAFAARRALDRGMQLGYIEAQLRDRFGRTQPDAVATVIAASRMPVTIEDLRMGLDEAAPELLGGGANESWWHAFQREFSGLIVVRKEGAPSPAPSERLARAKRRLEGGRVDAALAEVARMPGRENAQAWISAAQRYDNARKALDTIETAAILEPKDITVREAPVPVPGDTVAPAPESAPEPAA